MKVCRIKINNKCSVEVFSDESFSKLAVFVVFKSFSKSLKLCEDTKSLSDNPSWITVALGHLILEIKYFLTHSWYMLKHFMIKLALVPLLRFDISYYIRQLALSGSLVSSQISVNL